MRQHYFSRRLPIALWLALMILGVPIRAAAQTVTIGNVKYTIDTSTGEAKCIGQDNKNLVIENVVIEDEVTYNGKTYPVKEIAYRAFCATVFGMTHSNLSGSLTIGKNITTIGEEAFSGCQNLTGDLHIPESVTKIKSHAFYECSGFTGSLTIPNSVTQIGEAAFIRCSGFRGSLTISESLTQIADFTFCECSGFTGSLTIPNSVTQIGGNAFYGCSGFTGSLTIPNSVTQIGSDAFEYCRGLTGSLTIPNSVKKIEDSSFMGCSGFFGSLIIGNSTESIAYDAFNNCSGFKSLYLPAGLASIGLRAFGGIDFEEINCTAINPPSIVWDESNPSRNTFSNGTYSAKLNIPGQSLSEYKAADGWKNFSNWGDLSAPDKITLNLTSAAILPGQSIELKATVLPEDEIIDKTVTWQSSDEAIATVSENGLVSALKTGTVTITASTYNGLTAEATINVAKLALPTELAVSTGNKQSLQVSSDPEVETMPELTWTSSDESIATVDAQGVVSGIAEGTATIKVALTNLPDVFATCTVTVSNIAADGVSLDKTSAAILPGQSIQLLATVSPEDATVKTVSWTSSDESVATVSEDGLVTAIKSGTATITATTDNGLTAEATINVAKLVLTSNVSLTIGDTKTLEVSAEPEVETMPELTWTSSDESIATVDEQGLVKGIAKGTATVKVAISNMPEVFAECEVKINNPKLILTSSMKLTVGETKALEVTTEPVVETIPALTWSSSNEDCASVNEQGVVTAKSVGTATIKVAIADDPDTYATCEVSVNYQGAEVSFIPGDTSDKVIITSIPEQDCYIMPAQIKVPTADGEMTYSVQEVRLESQPELLKKVAYPEGITTNFSEDVIAVAYDAEHSKINNNCIINILNGYLVFVDMAASGKFVISDEINSVGEHAFDLCENITGISIENQYYGPLVFEGSENSQPAFASTSIRDVAINRNIEYAVSPFRGNGNIENLTLGSGITEIGARMVYGCGGIRELSIPASVTQIGDQAFAECPGLSQLFLEDSPNALDMGENTFTGTPVDYLYYGRKAFATWPQSIKAIETGRYVDALTNYEFTDMPNIYSLTIGVGTRTISDFAFRDSKITKVIWMPNTPPQGYKNISADVNYVSTNNYEFDPDKTVLTPNLSSRFYSDGLIYVFTREAKDRTCAVIDNRYNRYITGLDVPYTLTYQNIEFTIEEVSDYALYCNKYYETASIGDGITRIGKYALFNCSNISAEPYIGKAVKTVDDYAFNSCSAIPTAVIPDATEYLGKWSMANCTAMKNILLGKGLVTIETGCFANDVSLSQIVIPANVATIANQVFDVCTSLAYLEITDRTSTLSMGYSRHSDTYDPSQGTVGGLTTAGIPLFNDCPLKEVYIGGDITYSTSPADGYSPFYRNDHLQKVIIHNNETEISDNEFYGCRGLKEVVTGNDVVSVGNYAFSGCLSLEYFTLGKSVKTIGEDAFSDCDKMVEMKSFNFIPPTCGDQAMDDINKFNCTLIVPETAVDAYKNAPQWENFFHIEGMEVDEIKVESIDLKPTEWRGAVGSSFWIIPTITPEDASDTRVSWASSNVAVATVNADGRVDAVGVGSCVITARSNDGSDISATCNVEVLAEEADPIPVESIVLNPNQWRGEVGKTFQISATVLPSDADDKTLVWTSSDESVATVDANGSVTTLKIGNCVIVATAADGSEVSASCSVEVISSEPETILVETITLNPTEWSGEADKQFQVSATVLPANATYKAIVWTSSDETVATVDASGLVTTLKAGTCTITATAADGSEVSASCRVEVVAGEVPPVLVESITLNPTEWKGEIGKQFRITATVLPANADNKTLLWTSNDESIATVDANGLVTTLKAGSCVITATAADGSEVSAECRIEVVAEQKPVLVESITLNPSQWSGETDKQFRITATILPANADNKTLVWTSNDESIATVDANGLVTTLKAGSCVITATAADGSEISAECRVEVVAEQKPVLVESITLNPTEWKGETGKQFRITATVLPANADNKTLVWTSNDESIATVDANGLVTTLSAGTCIIYATSTDDSYVEAECRVTVEDPTILVESLTINPTSWNGEENTSFQITATVLPTNATDKGLAWSSSDESIATVDQSGRVNVLKEGTCVITVKTTDGSDLSAECIITSRSGIDEIMAEDSVFDIYDVSGLLIKKQATQEDLKQLNSGVYILRSGKTAKKIVVR